MERWGEPLMIHLLSSHHQCGLTIRLCCISAWVSLCAACPSLSVCLSVSNQFLLCFHICLSVSNQFKSCFCVTVIEYIRSNPIVCPHFLHLLFHLVPAGGDPKWKTFSVAVVGHAHPYFQSPTISSKAVLSKRLLSHTRVCRIACLFN